ncbi:unnamed protein product [Gongylonema pulchrum]|uniref:GIPC1-3 GH1 domain-containing protein n=1 Tax=Gongylonema pulchrum TaxID=637853 RepID=A0A183ESA2_9BILA|nr:unnamed protein product [Gongylonema pulchrum]
MERAERQRVLHAGNHGQHWKRRRLCEWVKKTRSANASPLRQQIKPNANDPSKVPDNRQQRTRSATPVRSADADSSEPWQVPIKKEDAPASGGVDGGGKLKFQVQLAHGSPTGIIGNFKSIAQLYQVVS